jgi:ankyrin repeat protein
VSVTIDTKPMQKTSIIVAIVTAVGVIIAALFSNYDKFARHPQAVPPQTSPNIQVNPIIQVNPHFQISTPRISTPRISTTIEAARKSASPVLDLRACLSQSTIKTSPELIEEELRDPKSLAICLIESSAMGNLTCVHALLEAGVPANGDAAPFADRVTHMTPLVAALLATSIPVANELLNHGANPNLRALAGSGHEDIGMPPIVAAALRSSELTVMLITRGADVSAADSHGMTALHWAASRGDLQLARSLVDHGADPQAKNRLEDKTAYQKALDQKHADVAAYLKGR